MNKLLVSILAGLVLTIVSSVLSYREGHEVGYDKKTLEVQSIIIEKENKAKEARAEVDKLTTAISKAELEFNNKLAEAKKVKYERPIEQTSDSVCNPVNADIMLINVSKGYPTGTSENPIVRQEDASKASSITQQELIEDSARTSELYELWRIRYEGLVKKVDAAGCFF